MHGTGRIPRCCHGCLLSALAGVGGGRLPGCSDCLAPLGHTTFGLLLPLGTHLTLVEET